MEEKKVILTVTGTLENPNYFKLEVWEKGESTVNKELTLSKEEIKILQKIVDFFGA